MYTLLKAFPDELLPFILILLVASPHCSPATFTLATALGSLNYQARRIVTRLSAVEEAAGMDVCVQRQDGDYHSEPTSTGGVRVYAPYSEAELLRWPLWPWRCHSGRA